MRTIWQDVRYGLRSWARSPGFTLVVVLTLAVAIGATSAIYSVVRATILDPLPMSDPSRFLYVTTFGSYTPEQEKLNLLVNPVTVAALRAHPDLFADFAVHKEINRRYQGGGSAEQVAGCQVSVGFLSMWDVRPLLGRLFHEEDGRPGTEPTIVLSHGFWKHKLEGDREIIGKVIEFGEGTSESPRECYRVVGVMPDHFKYPSESTAYWIATDDPAIRPLTEDPDGRAYRDRDYWVRFRLADGVAVAQVRALLDVIQARQIEDCPQANMRWTLQVHEVTDLLVDKKVRRSLWTLFAVIGVVWLIACANVASLLTARVEGRRHEIAVRGALGAARGRLMRQSLTESLLLAIAGGLGGLVVTEWGMRVLDAFLGGVRLRALALDWGVCGISMMIALATGVVFGLIPAWHASAAKVNDAIKQTGAVTQASSGRWLTRGLVTGEVALAFALLCGAGLMVQSVVRLLRVDVGYRADDLVRVEVSPPFQKYFDGSGARTTALAHRLHEAFLALPGVESVGVAVGGRGWHEHVAVDDPQKRADVVAEGCGLDIESPFLAMKASLLRGRFLDAADCGRNTVVVNEALARAFWPGGDALGKTFRGTARDKIWEVVGVVGDVKTRSFDQQVRPTFYRPNEDRYAGGASPTFFIRCRKTISLLRPPQTTIREVEPDMVQADVIQVSEELYEATASRRNYTLFLSLLTGAGVGLAAMGIYGLLANAAVRRTREMGIRMAVGATRDAVGWLLIREGATLAVAGVVLGSLGALVAGRLIRSQLFAVEPHDPITLLVAAAGLLGLAVLASVIPARRAARTDPMVALRCE